MESYIMMENRAFQQDTSRDDNEVNTEFVPSEISATAPSTHDTENGLSSCNCKCGPNCSRERLHPKNDSENKQAKVEVTDWSPLKGKIFLAIVCCLVIWAAVYFTLFSYGYV